MSTITRSPSELHRDDLGRFHSQIGPAIEWPDGDARWYWHGVQVPRAVIESELTVESIRAITNAEVKRCALERFGLARYLSESNASLVQEDSFGKLYRVDQEQYVVVENPTPNLDGTRRTFVLGVPNDVTTAHAAVAATWRRRPERFNPSYRS